MSLINIMLPKVYILIISLLYIKDINDTQLLCAIIENCIILGLFLIFSLFSSRAERKLSL